MDRRGWLWKKRSSDKIINSEKPVASSESVGSTTLSSVAHLRDQDTCKNKNYVQVSMESYTRMSGSLDQVVNLEDQVKALEAKLSAAYSDLNNKDNIVKQHVKVAEEAVSGWEKADAEVLSLRHQLESISLSKLAADDRASHLDGALKECMKQIRTVKEESEQKLQEVVLMKSQQWEKTKLQLEEKIDNLDGENATLLRSLQDSTYKIVKLIEEKSAAEAEVDLLKKNVQSCEKEITSLKYELHFISKEMDIRNEEKNIIMRSTEVANKQHKEDVKNIAKLEAECQRLRGLLRKKLPGPAALAQMKLEVGAISGTNLRKTCLRADSLQECEFLTKQLEVMEEETKTLREALAKSNSELQASKNLYAETVNRIKSLEAEIKVSHQERKMSNHSPSITSTVSDDGNEYPQSLVESCGDSNTDLSDIRRIKNIGKFENNKSETILELMNDFLEVEKMACLSDNGNVPIGTIVLPNEMHLSEEFKRMESENDDKASKEGEYMQDLKETKMMLQEKVQLLEELKAQLASSHKSHSLAKIQLKCMTESYKSLQAHAEELEAENKMLKEKMEELKNDLVEQKQCLHDALVRYKEIEGKIQRDQCSVCASNSAADVGINFRKDTELEAAEKKLVECQETLHILGRQLQALCPHIEINRSQHSKSPQMNEILVKQSHGWSNSCGSCNSNEIDRAEACSVSSDIQGVSDEFSSPNCGSTSCLSDTEGSFSLNSSIDSNQPGYVLTRSHEHGFSHFFWSKGKTGH